MIAGNGGSVNNVGGEYKEGANVKLIATPDEGYRFIGWSNGSEEESITITITKDISIEALFELIPKFSISVIASEGGTVSTNGGQYEQGSEISISATPNGCYNFLQWSDGSTDQERTIIAEEDTLSLIHISEPTRPY